MSSLRNTAAVLTGLLVLASAAGSQELLTAANFFNRVSEQYGALADYEARVVIRQGSTTMRGLMLYKNPNKLRIDFSDPANQVLASDGRTLTIHLPRYSVSFTQDLRRRSEANVANLASRQGLHLLRTNYSIAYALGPEPVPLEPEAGLNEPVTKLKLTWRSAEETFRQIDLAVNSAGYIRRITGVKSDFSLVQMDFFDYKFNQGLPDNRFQFDSPPTANRIHNFLFEPEN